MPKSTPMPTNRTAKATEIGLSDPTIINPKAAVIERPTKMLISTAAMMRGDRKASHRMPTRKASETMALMSAFSRSVANSSSWIGTGPVRRTRAPYCESSLRSAAVWRIALVAISPGSSAA